MTDVGILVRIGHGRQARYRPTPDALARFGGAAIGVPHRAGAAHVPSGDHDRLLRRIAADLSATYADVLAPETVTRFVTDSYDLLAARATVRRYLPALTARFAADRLAALTLERQGVVPHRDVLFVCVRNAGRSQIAAAVLRSVAGDRVRVRTAGSVPAGQIDPVVRAELAQRGLDALTEFPRPLTDEVVRASGVVVTMGCGDACPVFPGRRYVDWTVDDPSGRPRQDVARIVDDITARVHDLVRQIDP
ncbi:arsenate reductase ArsC [Cellulosimicrobium terreum]|uniref:Arsenate reductase ArsC n=2 Tax=Cellulosimicrobium funkei TaxID=264251 RepID=A0A4Y8QYG8_9MICO|nr:arsenate reductase ArsC [Cellulosimicrobium funkei]TGA67992.1 arsenate reductase ArsC [Cellulosimicrobium terreum]